MQKIDLVLAGELNVAYLIFSWLEHVLFVELKANKSFDKKKLNNYFQFNRF